GIWWKLKTGKLAESVSWLIFIAVIIKNNYSKIAFLRSLNMWKNLKVDPVNEKDSIFHELIEECKHAVPGARLSYTLRNRLEKYSPDIRRDIVNRIKVGCSPLFIACKKGQTEIADYLISVCQADIEQKGLYEVQEDRSTHVVTPLWCAAVSGKLPVVEILLKHGADINAVSDTGSTPVRSACFMTHFEIVKYLVEHGADINRPNYNGGTCLINSVQSAQLCDFLLKNGADVNARDIQNKTALHYAIQEHRLETTKLLLKSGANYNAKSRYGDDALQMACLKGATRIFEFLTSNISYPPEKLANAHELMGATYLDEHNDVAVAFFHWKEALVIRENHSKVNTETASYATTRGGIGIKKEFESMEELENISTELDLIRTQSLIIAERILGPHHKDTIFRLMYRGASYADVMRYQQMRQLLTIKPRYKRQLDFFDKILKCITHLIYLMIETSSEENKSIVTELITDLIRKNIKCVILEDTILHLCVSKLNTIRSSYFMDEEPIMIFSEGKVWLDVCWNVAHLLMLKMTLVARHCMLRLCPIIIQIGYVLFFIFQ
ncbi:hypothetical protein NQ314_001403, partial [Rhamnusium bicolor]